MGAVKRNLIPENYNCSHFLDVDDCMECQYAMHTSHLSENYVPSIDTSYNRKAKKTKITKKTIKDDCTF